MLPGRPTVLWQHDQQRLPRPQIYWSGHQFLQKGRPWCAAISPTFYNAVDLVGRHQLKPTEALQAKCA